MSSRLAFQTQLASIMEVLANAAVAEICKLVDDNYAVVSLQMSQCQKENKALKRKLHLLELKMARGTAERRLRESAFNSGRLRVQIRDASPSADGAFEQQSVSMWPDRALTASVTEHNERPQSKSPDVQFVEPVIVKEETKAEAKEEEIHVIEDNGLMECTPHAPERLKHNLEIQPSASNQVQTCAKPRTQTPPRPPRRNSATNRRVEEEDPDVVLVKVEEPEEMEEQKLKTNTPGLSIQEGLVESSTDDFKAALPFVDASQISTDPLQDSAQGISESESGDLLLKITVPSQSAAGSDFSLFELEPFFARWAPDSDPAAPPGASFGASVSAESEKSDVITVDDDKDRFMSVTGEQLQTSVSQALPSASSLSSIQIQSVHSQWTPAMLQNPLVLQNIRTAQQTHTNSNMPVSNSSTSASSSSAASSSINQHQISVQSHNSLKLKVGKKFICKTCGKPFPAWSNLEVHQRVHTGERPFKCDTCGKRFSEAGNLKKHQRVHTGEKPYSCNKCGKKFAWICNLKTHQQTATGCIQHQAWSAKE